MLTTIHITVRDRVPTITAGEDVISHNSDYVAEFEFDEEWQDKVKTVYFVCEDGSYQAVVMDGNSCGVPMLDGEHRRIFVGVQAGAAEKPSVLKTTRPCCLKVKDSIADYLGQPIPDPTPDVYEQIIAMLESITSPTWDALQDKPFSTLGSGLSVDENGVLSAQGVSGGSANAVQYVAQTLTDEQKAQARDNIGAKAATEKSAYIISKTRTYGYIRTYGMDFDGVYAQIQSGKVVMLLVDGSSTYYGVIHPASGTGVGKEIVFYNIADISDSGGRDKGIKYFGFTWRKGADSLTEWFGDIPRVKVDETLTESGSAADAKAVGDELQNYVSDEEFEFFLQQNEQVLNQKLDKNQGAGNAGKILGIGADGIVVPQDKPTYTLPQATADALGGIKADAATAEDTQVVRIGTDGKLRTKPTGGSIVTVDSELSSTSENPVQNKIVTATLAEKITAPTTAAVGQIIKVKSVDGTGKPTEWEAVTAKLANPNALTFTGAVTGSYDGSAPLSVEIPSGGGVESWELIADITTTELVQSVSITKDQAGQPLALKKAILMTNTKEERIDEVSYTGPKRIQVLVNGTTVLYGNVLLSSADSFHNSRTDLEIKNGQLFGEGITLIGVPSKFEWSPVVVLLEAETIESVGFFTDYQFVSGVGVVTRFSVGSQFKLYGVRA